MSKSNYRRCVGLGVTGKNTSTCFPASVDKILPQCKVDAEYYRHYDLAMQRYEKLPSRRQNPALKELYSDLRECIGSDELIFRRVEVLEELRDVVRAALRDRIGITVDTTFGDETHSLGLEVINRKLGHFVLVSTHVPHQLRGIVTLGYLFPHISQPEEPHRVRYPFTDANVTLIAA